MLEILAQVLALVTLVRRLDSRSSTASLALTKGYGKGPAVNGELAAFWSTEALTDWLPDFRPVPSKSERLWRCVERRLGDGAVAVHRMEQRRDAGAEHPADAGEAVSKPRLCRECRCGRAHCEQYGGVRLPAQWGLGSARRGQKSMPVAAQPIGI